MTPGDFPGIAQARGGVFYLHGSDEFRKEGAARALASAHLDDATRDFNYDLLRGSEVTTESLSAAFGTPPMMAEWRVVLMRETQALASSKRARTLLLKVAESPPPGLALILMCTVPDRSTARFYKDLERLAHNMEFATPSVNDLPGWLMDWSRKTYHRELTEDAACALAERSGGNSSTLALELEKLSTRTAEGEAITLEVVESTGSGIPRQDRWKWFDFIGERRFMEALDGLRILLSHGETGVGITIGMTTHLLRIGVVLHGGQKRLEAALPRNQRWLARRYGAQARCWRPEDLDEALKGLLEVDRLLKASPHADEHFLEAWVLAQASAAGVAA